MVCDRYGRASLGSDKVPRGLLGYHEGYSGTTRATRADSEPLTVVSAMVKCVPGACRNMMYVALFKLTGGPGSVAVSFAELGLPTGTNVTVEDCWSGLPAPQTGDTISRNFSTCSRSSSGACSALLLLRY